MTDPNSPQVQPEVGERVNASARGAPVVQVREVVECPQLYEVWQHKHAEWPATSNPLLQSLMSSPLVQV